MHASISNTQVYVLQIQDLEAFVVLDSKWMLRHIVPFCGSCTFPLNAMSWMKHARDCFCFVHVANLPRKTASDGEI